MPFKMVSDWGEMYERTLAVLTHPDPIFYGRIGGSDTDMVIDYLAGQIANDDEAKLLNRLRPNFRVVEEFNGYYDKVRSDANYLRFCESLMESYKSLVHASLVGSKWLTRYFKGNLNPLFWVEVGDKGEVYDRLLTLVAREHKECFLYPFSFIEKTTTHPWTMFNAFSKILKNRKILVISPFSRTVEANFYNRGKFFKRYEYPEFELSTYNVPITYKGLPDELYPHDDWFMTVDAMKSALSTMEFDIALLSCGSYAMPLGDFICQKMNRKAIYVGGVLQLYFGIIGRRYLNPFFLDEINLEYFVQAEERELYLKHIKIEPSAAHEAFGAYL